MAQRSGTSASLCAAEAPCAVRELVLSYDRRYAQIEDVLLSYTASIKKARAPPARLSTRHDPEQTALNGLRRAAMHTATDPVGTSRVRRARCGSPIVRFVDG